MPSLGARILRALDEHGLVGRGLGVVGTNAVFAYEAVAGRMLDAAVTTTEDLLMDSRQALRLVTNDDVAPDTMLASSAGSIDPLTAPGRLSGPSTGTASSWT